MCLSYVAHRWPVDMADPIALVEWEFEKREREDLINLLLRPWIMFALTERELKLWEKYHELYKAGQIERAAVHYNELVDRLRERGLV